MYSIVKDIKITDLFNPINKVEYKGFIDSKNARLYIITLCNVPDKVIMFYKTGFTRDPGYFYAITSVMRSISENDRYHITIRSDTTILEGLAEIINSDDVLEYFLDLNCA